MKIEMYVSDFLSIIKDKHKNTIISDDDESVEIDGWWHYYTIRGKSVILDYTEDEGDKNAFYEMCKICNELHIVAKIEREEGH